MKLAPCLTALALLSATLLPLSASESATDCQSATQTLQAGLESQPDGALMLFLDALQTNPGCRRNLLITALEFSKQDPRSLEKMIFIARQEFPGEQTLFAETALSAIPEHAELIREAFMKGEQEIEASLKSAEVKTDSDLVELPPEALALDDDIREAIARMAAKVEGKRWPEQEAVDTSFSFKQSDDLRVSRHSYLADETSLENSVPIDTVDEREISKGILRINDQWDPEEKIELDTSKFSKNESQASTELKEARKQEIAPAGAVGLPQRPRLSQSSVYYIPPADGDFRSTIDFDEQQRPSLVIRPASAFRSVPPLPDEKK